MKSLKRSIRQSIEPLIVSAFHYLWYHSPDTWTQNRFLGYHIMQCPLDLHLYQELVYQQKPDFIIQTGIAGGGSLLYFASLLDLIQAPPSALVIGVDIRLTNPAKTLSHPRIKLLHGSSTDPAIINQIKNLIPDNPDGNGLVILDSDHTQQHVKNELDLYHQFVSIGSYLVVEDTNINGNPVLRAFGPGPYEATQDFLKQNQQFISDDTIWKRNKFSFHQKGWLKRIS